MPGRLLTPVKVQTAATRWCHRLPRKTLDGDTLVHTDVTPYNFLIDRHTHVIDWSMPCRGAAWIDTALMTVRLIRAGHTPTQAETWAQQIPACNAAPPHAVTAFAQAVADRSDELARQAPAPHRQPLADTARAWANHRLGKPHAAAQGSQP